MREEEEWWEAFWEVYFAEFGTYHDTQGSTQLIPWCIESRYCGPFRSWKPSSHDVGHGRKNRVFEDSENKSQYEKQVIVSVGHQWNQKNSDGHSYHANKSHNDGSESVHQEAGEEHDHHIAIESGGEEERLLFSAPDEGSLKHD